MPANPVFGSTAPQTPFWCAQRPILPLGDPAVSVPHVVTGRMDMFPAQLVLSIRKMHKAFTGIFSHPRIIYALGGL